LIPRIIGDNLRYNANPLVRLNEWEYRFTGKSPETGRAKVWGNIISP